MGQTVDDRLRASVDCRVLENTRPAAADRYQQINCALNLVRDSVVALDLHGRITYLNHAAEELYGRNSRALVGRLARTTLFAESKLAFGVAWRAVLATGEWHGEMAHRTRSGTERLVECRWSALRDENSSKLTSILIIASEDSKMLTAGLAHEIRNPLAGIKGVADAFLQRRQLTRREREWMEAVRHEVVKIDARMREFLDVSQTRIFNVSLCSLHELIGRVVLIASHQLQSNVDRQARQTTLEFIDATTEPLVMPLDSALIEDAILNLVLNAIESIDGNGRVTVRLQRRSFANGDGEAVIEVSDTGCGIPLDIRRRMFEPLFTTKRGGTGLGLAAVRRTAAAYHGRITFKTRIGRGSTFVLTLPIRSQPNLAENPK